MKLRLLSAAAVVVALVTACATQNAEADRREILRSMYSSTVQIIVNEKNGVRRTGSGVVLAVDKDKYAYVLTARHVVVRKDGHEVAVLGRFRKRAFAADVLALGKNADLALLRTLGPKVTPVDPGGSAVLGDEVWVVSYPWGRRRTLVTGVISQVEWPTPPTGQVPLDGPVSLVDASVGYGTSGGGVFAGHSGRLLGIVRGYRSVKVSVGGPDKQSVSLPIAGETTVVSMAKIRAFLKEAGFPELIKAPAP